MKKIEETNKFLSFVLRHRPESIGIKLDSEDWVMISALIVGAQKSGKRLTHELIAEVVATNDKKRFALSSDNQRIRAVQGHSTASVSIEHSEKTPPAFLYHRTASRFITSIRQSGLKPARDTMYIFHKTKRQPPPLEHDMGFLLSSPFTHKTCS